LLAALQHKDSIIVNVNVNIHDTTVVNIHDTTIVNKPDTTTIIQPPLAYTLIQPTCNVATGSITLTGLPTPEIWTINPGNITGTGTTKTITGLKSGTYNIVVTNIKGYISPTITIIIYPQPITPTIPIIKTVIQPTCNMPTGSIILSELPIGNWTINPGNITGTGITKTITELTSGTYNYSVTNDVGCTSPSVVIIINLLPLTPTAPVMDKITQPTCNMPTGSIILSGLPIGNWTINPGNITGTGTTKTITELTSGTYNYTVTNDVGCTSLPLIVIINPQPITPAAPVIDKIIQPTYNVETGSVVLTGLPPTGVWTISKIWGTNKISFTGTGTSVTVKNLDPKGSSDVKGVNCVSTTYNFTVTNESGCTSPLSKDVIITSYN
jgi:uncharacterized protein (DUF2141 family)